MMYVVLLALISAVFAQPPPACPPFPACPTETPMTCAPPPLPEGVAPPLCGLPPICVVAMADCPGFGSTADYPTVECPELPPCPTELPMTCIPPECPECACPIPPMCVVAMADCPSN